MCVLGPRPDRTTGASCVHLRPLRPALKQPGCMQVVYYMAMQIYRNATAFQMVEPGPAHSWKKSDFKACVVFSG